MYQVNCGHLCVVQHLTEDDNFDAQIIVLKKESTKHQLRFWPPQRFLAPWISLSERNLARGDGEAKEQMKLALLYVAREISNLVSWALSLKFHGRWDGSQLFTKHTGLKQKPLPCLPYHVNPILIQSHSTAPHFQSRGNRRITRYIPFFLINLCQWE